MRQVEGTCIKIMTVKTNRARKIHKILKPYCMSHTRCISLMGVRERNFKCDTECLDCKVE